MVRSHICEKMRTAKSKKADTGKDEHEDEGRKSIAELLNPGVFLRRREMLEPNAGRRKKRAKRHRWANVVFLFNLATGA